MGEMGLSENGVSLNSIGLSPFSFLFMVMFGCPYFQIHSY
jgi:hypothetical protein